MSLSHSQKLKSHNKHRRLKKSKQFLQTLPDKLDDIINQTIDTQNEDKINTTLQGLEIRCKNAK